MSYNDLINNLIPADDLHWCKEEQKYVSLSEDEINDVILRCVEQGISDISDIHKMIQWCGAIRIGQLLWKNFLLGSLNVSGFDRDNEPRFIANRENQ
jgi:hypothetical protein